MDEIGLAGAHANVRRAGFPRDSTGPTTLERPRPGPNGPKSADAAGVANSRWRVLSMVRRLVAIALVALALWWLVVPVVFPIASEAVVNASVVQVRAPIDGVADELRVRVGDCVQAGDVMLRIHNPKVDLAQLTKLRTQRAEICARQKRLETEIAEVQAATAICTKAASSYRQGRITLLKAKVRETSALIEACKYQQATAEAHARRSRELAKQNSISTAELESAAENVLTAQKRIEQLEAELARTTTELEATGQGLFLQTETPYCVQRAEELAMRIPLLRANLHEAEELCAALGPELEREETRVRALSESIATSPVSGMVWNCNGNLGQAVIHNEAIYQIADSSDVFVEALLHQRHLTSVEVGSRATIVVTGGKVYTGRVRAVRAGGASEPKSIYAMKLAGIDNKQVSVLIDFDSCDVACDLVGRHARVMVTPAEPGPSDRVVAWIFSWVGR